MISTELEHSKPPLNSEQQFFNYEDLDNETRVVVQQRTSEIKSLVKRNAQEVIEIGQKLIDVKEKLGHGKFRCWLKAEFSWGPTTAWKYMKVTETFKCSPCEHLDIAASALYLLATPSVPESARNEALERANQGEPITRTAARAIIQQHKPKEELTTINVPAETVESEVWLPTERRPVPHHSEPLESQPLSENGGSAFVGQDSLEPPLVVEPELSGEDDKEEVFTGTSQSETLLLAEETLLFDIDDHEEVCSSRNFCGHGGPEQVDSLESSNSNAYLLTPDSDQQDMPPAVIDSVLQCLDEIARLNATFPSPVFYLGIEQEWYKQFSGTFHKLDKILTLYCLNKTVGIGKTVT